MPAISNILRGKYRDSSLYFLRISTAGVLSGPSASKFTSVRNGAGDYSITAVTAFAEPPYVAAITRTADIALSQVAPTSSVVNIKSRSITTSPAATDAAIDLIIYGCPTAANATGQSNMLVSDSLQNVKILSLHINGSDGVLSGPDAAYFTSGKATGDYTLTAVAAFAEPPFVLVTSNAADKSVAHVAPTTTVLEVKTRTVGATPAASDTNVDVIVIGAQVSTVSPDIQNP
jgi:hypothetical protein